MSVLIAEPVRVTLVFDTALLDFNRNALDGLHPMGPSQAPVIEPRNRPEPFA